MTSSSLARFAGPLALVMIGCGSSSAAGPAAGTAGAGGASSAGGASAAGGSGGGGQTGPYTPPPAATIVEQGAVSIRREVFFVAGVDAGENPTVAGSATPPELAKSRVVRYRVDSDPPKPAKAIVVLMPGFLGGAGSLDGAARALVRRSTEGAAIEAWAIDRRSNLMEDHHGLEVAEFRQDAELAHSYYLDAGTLEGKSFAGFKQQSDVPWESEWGIPTTIGDLRNVISIVPPAERRGRVVLLGHSLGATIVEEYAAWDFAGTAGYAELAGLALVDGVSGAEGDTTPPRPQDKYEKGGDMAPGGFGTAPGVADIRKSLRYFALPLLGTKVYPVAAIAAMRSVWTPKAITPDDDRDKLLQTLLSLTTVPKLTNRAAMGFAFDVKSNGLSFAAVSCGQGTGGELGSYDSVFGSKLIHPSDPLATYEWTDWDMSSPKGNTSLDDFARVWFDGPGLDFAEWYFPQRLTADAPIASTLVLKAGDFAYDDYAMRATHGAEIDLPVLAAPAALLGGDVSKFDKLKALIAPVGANRPLAGKPRSDAGAFHLAPHPELTHIDSIAATDAPGSAGRAWYDELSAFVGANTTAGGVVVPVQP